VLVPYHGGAAIGAPSVSNTVAGWAARNGCDPTRELAFANGDVRCETFTGCSPDGEVTLCTVDGGGHTWPGGVPIPALGPTTRDLSATDAMWEFFAEHPLPVEPG
jgi:polyhydroxybutyrate depolymerase